VIDKIKDRKIDKKENLLDALKQMDLIDKKLLLVFDDNQFVNILSVGDIQRAIIKNLALTTPIQTILRKETRLAFQNETFEIIKQRMLEYRTECMPVVNDENELIDAHFWEDVFPAEKSKILQQLNLPVVIMAGGKGTRLKPLTNVIPKPLLPFGERTIIEEIINRFVSVGCDSFYLSVNYKAETIIHYFQQLASDNYHIDYFQEEKPLGTIGSLYLTKDKIKSTFFVSNCDIIIEEDYSEILKYHQENKNELTIVSALKHYPIPYGTISTEMDGLLNELIEKPELTFQINSGFYILEPHLLNEIPENEFFHITTLIENIQNRKGRVGVFPVSEKSWIDIGTLDEYLKLMK
jgi:dTDP-glucose pyrophosphorylase